MRFSQKNTPAFEPSALSAGGAYTLRAFLVASVLIAAGCAESTSDKDLATPSGCASGSAQIGIFGSFGEPLCGCQEPAGTAVAPPASVNCTVPAGTVVLFQLMQPEATHQIRSVGNPAFPSSTVDTMDDASAVAHAFYFTVPGRYHYEDAYNTTIQGDIIVQ